MMAITEKHVQCVDRNKHTLIGSADDTNTASRILAAAQQTLKRQTHTILVQNIFFFVFRITEDETATHSDD